RFGKLLVSLSQYLVLPIEIAKHVSNLTRVIGAQVLASRIGRHVTEAIQVSPGLSVSGHSSPRAHVQREQPITQHAQISRDNIRIAVYRIHRIEISSRLAKTHRHSLAIFLDRLWHCVG